MNLGEEDYDGHFSFENDAGDYVQLEVGEPPRRVEKRSSRGRRCRDARQIAR